MTFSVLLFSGILIGLSSFLYAAITGNEDIMRNPSVVYPLVLGGLGLIIVASIFQKNALYCVACKQPLASHAGSPADKFIGGLLGIIMFLGMKECPNCHKKLN